MRKKKTKFAEYVAATFKAKLLELGWSQLEFCRRNPRTNQPTLSRLLRADGNTNIDSLAYYADVFGYEIILRPKSTDNEN